MGNGALSHGHEKAHKSSKSGIKERGPQAAELSFYNVKCNFFYKKINYNNANGSLQNTKKSYSTAQ